MDNINVSEKMLDDYNPAQTLQTTNSTPMFSNTAWIFIIVFFILFLASIGLNIFTYLSQATQSIVNNTSSPIHKILVLFGLATKEVIDTAAVGVETGVNFTAGTVKGALTGGIQAVENETPLNINNNISSSLKNSIQPQTNEPEPDSSTSSIQSNTGKNWCYIGEERQTRVCAQVSDNYLCQSQDIFPSEEICINPSLRQ
jgi:hypothetical protein